MSKRVGFWKQRRNRLVAEGVRMVARHWDALADKDPEGLMNSAETVSRLTGVSVGEAAQMLVILHLLADAEAIEQGKELQ